MRSVGGSARKSLVTTNGDKDYFSSFIGTYILLYAWDEVEIPSSKNLMNLGKEKWIIR